MINRWQRPSKSSGFTLAEVVLSIGVFFITVLALIGFFGPTLKSVSKVEKTDEIAAIVDSVNAFLQSSPQINKTGSRFEAVYNAVQSGNYATILAFRARQGNTTILKLGFVGETDAVITKNDIYLFDGRAAAFRFSIGPIYRVVLTPSSAVPLKYHHATETKIIDGRSVTVPKRYRKADNGEGNIRTDTYRLANAYSDINLYTENSFAMEVRIFAEELTPDHNNFDLDVSLEELEHRNHLFAYNTAILRD